LPLQGISIRWKPYFGVCWIVKNRDSSLVKTHLQARLFAFTRTESSAIDFSTGSLLWVSVRPYGTNWKFRTEITHKAHAKKIKDGRFRNARLMGNFTDRRIWIWLEHENFETTRQK
jgi:hypothetical protein